MRNFIFGLLLGSTAGAGITYYIMKNKIEKQINETRAEIRKELKEYYERQQAEEDEAKATHVKLVPDKPDVSDVKKIVIDNNYIPDEDIDKLVEETESVEKVHKVLADTKKKCKILTPEQFGEISTYECTSMTYYVYDMTLLHEDGSIVDDAEYYLDDALDRYDWRNNDEEEEPLYVRNYRLEKDIEIIKVLDEYIPD